jgi:adenine-specific DNA-methyltransferase
MQTFIQQPMLTCIGNKRKVTDIILSVVEAVKGRLEKDKLDILDGFCGSTVVSRVLSFHASSLSMNDLELYSHLMSICFFKVPSVEQQEAIRHHIETMNQWEGPWVEGPIATLYAPKDSKNIQEGERCFYTRENALFIDTCRTYIETKVPKDIQVYCLVPLLIKASIHTNTAGVFKGFYKKDGIGCFGGSGENALDRITQRITLSMPLWSPEPPPCRCFHMNINELVEQLEDKEFDLIYLDPPYNQHPYGSNYFMLNLIARGGFPDTDVSPVSGIPKGWNTSAFNYRASAIESMKDLLQKSLKKASYVLISYNNEGTISSEEWIQLLEPYTFTRFEFDYPAYKGSRNLANRSKRVVEIMYLVRN